MRLAVGAVRGGHFAFPVLFCLLVEMGYKAISLYLSLLLLCSIQWSVVHASVSSPKKTELFCKVH